MRISDNEVKKILSNESVAHKIVDVIGDADAQADDQKLVQQLTTDIEEMSDREEMIADLRARIQAGTYNPTGDEIADTMIRRAIADRVR